MAIGTFVSDVMEQDVPLRLSYKAKTKFKDFDDTFGGGVDPGYTCFFTGASGGGKTTLIQQAAFSIVNNTRHKAHVNLSEQTTLDVRKKLSKLGFDGQKGFSVSDYTFVEDLFSEVSARGLLAPDSGNPNRVAPWEFWLFLDSLDGLRTVETADAPKYQQQKDVIYKLYDWAKRTFSIVFILGHVNKTGEAAGSNSLIHKLDGHLHLCIEKKTQKRFLWMPKNRGGPTFIKKYYTLNPKFIF